jgi:hypothetical protein
MAEKSLSPEELKEANKLAAQLGKTFDATKDSADAIRDRIKAWRIELSELNSDVNSAYGSFVKITNELKNTNIASQNIKKAYSSLTSIAEKIQLTQQGISALSLKDVASLKDKIKLEQQRIANSIKLLEDEKTNLKGQKGSQDRVKEINRLIDEQNKRKKETNKQVFELNTALTFQEQLLKKQNNLLGLGGNVINVMAGAMDKLGLGGLKTYLNFDKAKQAMDETSLSIAQGIEKGNKLTVLSKGLSALFSGFGKALLDPITIILAFLDVLKSVDKEVGILAKSFGTSYEQASNIRGELNNIANLSGDININTERLQKSLLAINQAFGTNTMLSGALLKDFTQMVEVQGYSNEAAIGLTKISTLTGNEVNKIQKEILGQAVAFNKNNKLALNEKEILEAVAKTSDRLKLSLGLGSKQLTDAVGEAKKLGLTLDEVAKIGDSLLQFESSISAELEAELLTGKQINLEKARYYALTNDAAGLARELSREIGTSADFSKMNRIQQEALAKSLGMNADQLATTLVTQEALQKIGVKDEEAARKKFDTLVKLYGYEEAVKRIGDEKYGQQLKSQSIQERFNASVQKLQEVFVSLAEPVLKIVSPFMDLVTTILPLVNIALIPLTTGVKVIGEGILYVINSVKSLIGVFSGANEELTITQGIVGTIASSYLLYKGYVQAGLVYQGISAALSTEKALAENASKTSIVAQRIAEVAALPFKKISAILSGTKAIAEVTAAEALTLGIATIAIIGGLAMVVSAMKSSTPVGDMSYSPGKETIISTKEGGLFKPSNNDQIAVGPKVSDILLNDKKETLTNISSTNASIDLNPLLNEIRALREAINSRPIMVETKIELDGQQISYNQSTGTNSFRS